jgi:hypothetical protein
MAEAAEASETVGDCGVAINSQTSSARDMNEVFFKAFSIKRKSGNAAPRGTRFPLGTHARRVRC